MNNTSQDCDGRSSANLKKLYSAHVLENQALKRQKSDLDLAKVKKIQQMNHEERSFLRKYEKYTARTPQGRSGSIDVGLARLLDVNAHSRSSTRDKNDSTAFAKSFGRDIVNSSCPYSLDSWGKLTESDTSLLEEQKQQILFDNSKQLEPTNNIESDTVHDYFSSNKVDDGSMNTSLFNYYESDRKCLGRSYRKTSVGSAENSDMDEPPNLRRPKLEPILRQSANVDHEYLDEEIVQIQTGKYSRAKTRRHSLADPFGVSREKSMDFGKKLPSIKRADSVTEVKGSPRTFVSERNKSQSSENVPNFRVNRRLSLGDVKEMNVFKSGRRKSVSNIPVYSPVPEMKVDSPISERSEGTPVPLGPGVESQRVLLDINTDTPKNGGTLIESLRNTPKPIATATLFIKDDTSLEADNVKQSVTMFDEYAPDRIYTGNDSKSSENIADPRTVKDDLNGTSFLSNKSAKALKPITAIKHISFADDMFRQRADSEVSNLSEVSRSPQVKKKSAKLTTATLKLLVDSHHGSAKLRYIALLATEMERENGLGNGVAPEPDPMEQVSNCRYLRVRPSANDTDS